VIEEDLKLFESLLKLEQWGITRVPGENARIETLIINKLEA
jgi:hypothetical protein